MLNNEEKAVIESTLDEIQKKYKVTVLFGSIIGSRSMNLNNNTSDLDFYLIFENSRHNNNHNRNQKQKDITINWLFPPDIEIISKYIQYNRKDKLKTKIDFVCFEIYRVLDSVNDYISNNTKFPTYYYKKGISNDDGQFLIYRILSSDYLWDRKYIKKNYEKLKKTFVKINILDYYFTRARGNLDNYLQDERVRVRKYLYTLHEIYCIKWILTYNSIPPLDFYELYKEFANNVISRKIEFLLEINKGNYNSQYSSISKENLIIEQDTHLYNYIENELNMISEQIKNLELESLIEPNQNSLLYRFIL